MAAPHPAETNDGVVTSWIPLTTVWPSVSGCSDSLMLEGSRLVAFDPGYGISINSEATCAPPAMTTWWNQDRLGGGSGTGHTAVSILPLTCPEGFSTVATSVKNNNSTLAMCCPPGYVLTHGIPGSVAGDCASNVRRGAVLTYASTPSTDSNTWTMTSTTLSVSSTVGAIGVVGWNIKAATVAPSTSTISTTSTTSTSSAAPSSSQDSLSSTQPTTSIQSTSTSTEPTSASSEPALDSLQSTSDLPQPSPTAALETTPSSDLTIGAKVGLGVGIPVGIIGLVALATAIWILRRRRTNAKMQPQPQTPIWEHKPELHNTPVVRSELDGFYRPPIHELPSDRY